MIVDGTRAIPPGVTVHYDHRPRRPGRSPGAEIPLMRPCWLIHVVVPVLCREVQPLQVGCPGAVQGLAGPPGVEPDQVDGGGCGVVFQAGLDRKSTRLNSSHVEISYAV